MNANYMNYFKEKKLYQWDQNRTIFTISETNIFGEFCLDKKGMEMFLKFSNPTITIGKTLTVKSGNGKASIKLSNGELTLPNLVSEGSINIDVDKLRIAAKFTAKDGNMPIISGVNIIHDYIVATDKYSAFRSSSESDCNIAITPQFIQELKGLTGTITINFNKNSIFFTSPEKTIVGRLLDGFFPSLEKAFSIQRDKTFELDKNDLQSIFTYSTDKNDLIVFENNKITIFGENEYESYIELPLGDVTFNFQIEKLINVVNSITDSKMTVKYADGTKPVIVNDNYLLVPVKRGA